jgi:hypothetical protein
MARALFPVMALRCEADVVTGAAANEQPFSCGSEVLAQVCHRTAALELSYATTPELWLGKYLGEGMRARGRN